MATDSLASNEQSTWTPDELTVALLRASGPGSKELSARAADAIERLHREEARLCARLQEEREASRVLAARIPPSETKPVRSIDYNVRANCGEASDELDRRAAEKASECQECKQSAPFHLAICSRFQP